MSQVVEMPEDMLPKFSEMVERSDHIVVLENLGESKEYYRKVYPASTHFEKLSDSVYTEVIGLYKVVKVIKSSRLKENSEIWLWKEPAYGEGSARAEHELGELGSPIISQYHSKFPITKNDKEIVYYLRDIHNPKVPDTYDNFEYGMDSVDSIGKIEALLKQPQKSSIGPSEE